MICNVQSSNLSTWAQPFADIERFDFLCASASACAARPWILIVRGAKTFARVEPRSDGDRFFPRCTDTPPREEARMTPERRRSDMSRCPWPWILESSSAAKTGGVPIVVTFFPKGECRKTHQSITTFPASPVRMASKPAWKSSASIRWVMRPETSSGPCTKAIILYQVSNISRP